jgi:hypothetical protein
MNRHRIVIEAGRVRLAFMTGRCRWGRRRRTDSAGTLGLRVGVFSWLTRSPVTARRWKASVSPWPPTRTTDTEGLR